MNRPDPQPAPDLSRPGDPARPQRPLAERADASAEPATTSSIRRFTAKRHEAVPTIPLQVIEPFLTAAGRDQARIDGAATIVATETSRVLMARDIVSPRTCATTSRWQTASHPTAEDPVTHKWWPMRRITWARRGERARAGHAGDRRQKDPGRRPHGAERAAVRVRSRAHAPTQEVDGRAGRLPRDETGVGTRRAQHRRARRLERTCWPALQPASPNWATRQGNLRAGHRYGVGPSPRATMSPTRW